MCKRLSYMNESAKYDWTKVCQYLGSLGRLRKLRLVVEGGRPKDEWDGPKELLVSDLRLLCRAKHDVVDWVTDLGQAARLIEEVEIVPRVGYLVPPKTTSMVLYAALSASLSSSLVEFLRSDLDLQVVAVIPTINSEISNAYPSAHA
jgi:hypothetical protein